LKFLDDPENDFALLHVLLSPIFHMNEETLRRLRYGKKPLFVILSKSHPSWTVTKILTELLSLVHFCNPYELIYRIYTALHLKISYALATLLDVALKYTKDEFSHLSSFIDWVERVGSAIEIKEAHPEGVKIFTVHKAKGLEFEVVIIPETNGPLRFYENRRLLFAFTEDNTRPEKIYWRSYGKYFPELKDAEEARMRRDAFNLLYVALTRAKNGVYILGYNHPRYGQGLWLNSIAQKVDSVAYSIGEVIKKERLVREGEEKPYGITVEEPLVIKEERSLYSPTEHGVEIIEPSRRRGMEFGTMVHQALSRIEWLDGHDVNTIIDEIMVYIKNTYARQPEDEEEIEATVRPLVKETLIDPELHAFFYKNDRDVICKNEVPIYFEEEKRDVSGHIDRLIREGDTIHILDYKTGEEKPGYTQQMRTYKNGISAIYPQCKITPLLIYLEKERGKKIIEV
jgi:ATP-dependent exoDNAse (exonuclease V) beta subunit